MRSKGTARSCPDPQRILDLPKGFRYTVLSRTGDTMDDGFRVPGWPDGMAVFPAPNGRVIVVRNHEMTAERTFEGAFGLENELFSKLDPSQMYDAGMGRPHLGDTTTLVYYPAAGRVERQCLSLAGTLRNCAGGQTPWGSWITCEEAVDSMNERNEKNHGYNFEVPATTMPGLAPPVPLKDMGRFNHEAVAVDPRTSIVYQTEDRNDGLIYRYIPNTPGVLSAGGRLQALAILDKPTADTRNWAETGAARFPIGERHGVSWIDLDDVDTPLDDLRQRGAARGAAVFARGGGMWYGSSEVYFACTNGGLSQRGQIFRYVQGRDEGTSGEEAAPGALQLYLEPNNAALLESVDNVGIAPWGDLLMCEDNAAPAERVVQHSPLNYLRGVTSDGKIYTLGRNRYAGSSELAGACFAPGHPTLSMNIQRPGITLAVTGPWNDLRR